MSAPVRRATMTGCGAIIVWASLALLTTMTGAVPPFLLVALAFALAFAGTLVVWCVRGGDLRARFCWPWRAWLVGTGGLFGYHFFYFLALRSAPAAEASLVNYLWPLLIVLFSAMLPGHRLRAWHVGGALCGLAGTVLLISDGTRLGFPAEYAKGYAAALACAVIWAGYSVLSRRFADVSSEAVGAFCGATALLAAASHLAFETTVWPQGSQWLAVIAMGAGPVGAAFFAWDAGMKRGDIRVLGAAAYLTPLLSTGLLVAFGRAPATWILAASSLLITVGAALAAKDMFASPMPCDDSR
ncbi:MAG: EamA family transporter [Rhodospirillales bacterium]|nr:EamA family transporter [Rhodospirillales bacterium]